MSNRRKALLIACDTFDDDELEDLHSPVSDAERLKAVLGREDLGDFDVHLLSNPHLSDLHESIYDFFNRASRTDVLLLFLSGHGLRDHRGRFYFGVPTTKPGALPPTALPGSFLKDQLEDTLCQQVVVILDCCYAGAFAKDLDGKSASDLSAVAVEEFEGHCRAILSASSAVQIALEGLDDESGEVVSVFSAALAGGIESGDADLNGDGLVGVEELFSYTKSEIKHRRAPQTPEIRVSGIDANLTISKVPSTTGDITRDESVRHAMTSKHHELQRAGLMVVRRHLAAGAQIDYQAAQILVSPMVSSESRELRREAHRTLQGFHVAQAVTVDRVPREFHVKSLRVDTQKLRAALNRAEAFASVDYKPDTLVVNEVRIFSGSGRGVVASGTDGFRMSLEFVPAPGGSFVFDEILPRGTADMIHTSSPYTVIYKYRGVLFLLGESDRHGVSVPTLKHRFPRLARIVVGRSRQNPGFEVEAAAIRVALEQLEAQRSPGDRSLASTVLAKIDGATLNLEMDRGPVSIAIPVLSTSEDVEDVYLNMNYLHDVVTWFPSDGRLWFEVVGSARPLAVRDRALSGRRAILMTMQPPETTLTKFRF
ncbi:hypothetical protein Acsp06_54110 [Actinomycetospora sp. NBRC 106375]|uniref:caspase family protein n=1 Tax=Actinomycetospora sp. NBRC 106375 TaxID=3032207 RepID=UPI0024A2E4B0|nr:caspase family protein [Actinomycetospora sp. NBRC 106375]GLZ49226.1 hypothetical protein Acsp06_54110 [Actinomycetospora sp. NBRC 106375]